MVGGRAGTNMKRPVWLSIAGASLLHSPSGPAGAERPSATGAAPMASIEAPFELPAARSYGDHSGSGGPHDLLGQDRL
jgi:hypothetical protein